MRILKFQCPRCTAQTEINLDSEASMVLLACHSCKVDLMYYYGEVFEVDEVEMTHLKGNEFKALQGYRKIQEPRRVATQTVLPRATHKVGQAVRETSVSQDDLLNLKIDLEVSRDVDDFLRRQGF